ncbi:MAG TPA: SUMF1/EgtB/PvdO family nonheme iron enzyme [Terriglobia bacterium]|nr:SUMF1/EgtB/PvdO family nonheme iron enzyme [Terriglobia bacterium]
MEAQRQIEIQNRMAGSRTETDKLFDLVRPDSLYERPIPERHRLVFYLGHLEAFDWNLLREPLGLAAFHPAFDKLFAFGIDPVDGGLPSDTPSDWPSIEDVRGYNQRIRRALDAALWESPRTEGLQPQDHRVRLNVAIEHRLMHAETLAYLLHQLPLERKVKPSLTPFHHGAPVAPGMVEIPAGAATLGIPRGNGHFGWDNEFEESAVDVPAFAIDRYKVTNREFLRFLEAGGYEERSLWAESDWAWRTEHNVRHPAFWLAVDGRWHLRTMFDEIGLPLDWPVYVSHAEAGAYARWAGKALPTEAQWHRAAYGTPRDKERPYPWGSKPPEAPKCGNFDFAGWDPACVNAFPEGRSAFGAEDLLGNGWEWTASVFEPFPGFEPLPFYPGYSANFFDGHHYVMKGGSPRTAACMLRRSFRNWFQPHYPYIYAGFRCVSN